MSRSGFSFVFACLAMGIGGPHAAVAAQTHEFGSEAYIEAATGVVESTLRASKADDIDAWLSHFTSDAIFEVNGIELVGPREFRRAHRAAIEAGAEKVLGKLKHHEVLEVGWTGARMYAWERWSYSSGMVLNGYSEYEVLDGKIVYMLGEVG